MARSKGTSIENNFIGGFNTEATALSFPTNACTSTKNCIFTEQGRVKRRKEIDIEQGGVYSSEVSNTSTYAYTEYMWHNAGGSGLHNLLVIQDGATLRFYNVSSSTTAVSTNQLVGTVNLTTYKVLNTPHSVEGGYCQYAVGNGVLLVVHKACEPIIVKFNTSSLAISVVPVDIKYRDFIGIDTSYAQNLRPSFDSIAALKGDATGSLHFYNLLNQGWHIGSVDAGSPSSTSALGQWTALRTDVPSDQDYVGYYRASPTDSFDPDRVDNNSQGNTPAPKGHFILDLGNADRRQALINSNYTLDFTNTVEELVPQLTGTSIAGAGPNGGITSSTELPIAKNIGVSSQIGAVATSVNEGLVALNVESPYDDNFNNALYRSLQHTTTASTGTKELPIVSIKNYSASPKNIARVVVNPQASTGNPTFNNSFGYAYVNEVTGSEITVSDTSTSYIKLAAASGDPANLGDGLNTTSVLYAPSFNTTGSKSVSLFVGKNLSATPRKIVSVSLTPSSNAGFGYIIQTSGSPAGIKSSTISFELRAHTSAPSTGSEGTLLASTSRSITSANYLSQSNVTLTNPTPTTLYPYVWIKITNTYNQTSTGTTVYITAASEFNLSIKDTPVASPAFFETSDYVFQLRGHTSAPLNGTEGTLLGSASFNTNLPGSHSSITINSSDTTTNWNYVWVYFKQVSTKAAGTIMDTVAKIGEIQFYTVNSTTTGAGLSSGSAVDLFDNNQTTGIIRTNTYVTTGTKDMDIFGGKNYSSSSKRVAKVTVRPFYTTSVSYGGSIQNSVDKDVSITFQLRGHTSAPTNGTEGTLLGSYTFSSQSSTGHPDVTITSSDTSTSWNYVWVYAKITTIQDSTNSLQLTMQMSSLQFYTAVTVTGTGSLPGADISIERPTACAFYAGRAWFAGIDGSELSTTIYFSQIIERDDQYGKCYQENDPTSESFFALLDSDGGTFRIPEIGRIVRLWPQQNTLLIFATNGIWSVQGSERNTPFNASNYSIKRISSLGTQSPRSFVDIAGLPSWWGEDSIYQMDYNPQFDSFEVKSISIEKVQKHFLGIDPFSRSLVKGAYDSRNDIAYWIYSRDTMNLPNNQFDTVLMYNKRSKSFYEWDISISKPRVVGLSFVMDSTGFSDPIIKFTTIVPITASTKRLTFSDCVNSNPSYTDWLTFSTSAYGTSVDAKDFTSYFITGYKLDGETQRFFQSNYIMVFLETEDNSGAYLQGIYDFTNSGNSGKWSSRQEIYNSTLTNRDINYRRLKIRGKGRALQLKITSKSGKPFNIIGWSIFETSNTEL